MIKYILALLIPALAFAQSDLTARVVILEHPKWPQGFISELGAQLTAQGGAYLHSLHNAPGIRVVDIRRRKDPRPELDGFGDWGTRFYSLRASRMHKRLRRGVDLVYYVVSPMDGGNGIFYMGGVAGGFCRYRSQLALAMGQARDFNEQGQSRIVASQLIFAHEMGHLMSMRHVASATIMNATALHLQLANQLNMIWDPQNLVEHRECLGK